LTTCSDITKEGIIHVSINGANGFIIPASTQHYLSLRHSKKQNSVWDTLTTYQILHPC